MLLLLLAVSIQVLPASASERAPNPEERKLRVIVFGAHPDDAELQQLFPFFP